MKFTTPYITITNPIPDEVKIYYSKSDTTIKMVLLFILLVLGVFFIITNIFLINMMLVTAVAVFCILAIYLIYTKYEILAENVPQIIINKKGLQTVNTRFLSWADIMNEKVSHSVLYRSNNYYLEFKFPGGDEYICISCLNVKQEDLTTLLRLSIQRTI